MAQQVQQPDFNSSMVRLELQQPVAQQVQQPDFNSSMVRLEFALITPWRLWYLSISIPQWCD